MKRLTEINNPLRLYSLLGICLFLSLIPLSSRAGSRPDNLTDSTDFWHFSGLPVVGYNNDLGLQLGLTGQVTEYQGFITDERTPVMDNFKQKFQASAFFFTKGAWMFSADYDSGKLLGGPRSLRLTASVSYLLNPLCGFYGFNGAVSPFNSELNLRKDSAKEDGIAFYSAKQQVISSMVNLKGSISGNWWWNGKVAYSWQRYDEIDSHPYKGSETLFHEYLDAGLLTEDETRGSLIEVKGNVQYDSRNHTLMPQKGIFATAGLSFDESLGKASDRNGLISRPALSAELDFRQYLSLIPDRLVFAYQLGYNGSLAGSLPFYALPAFTMRGCYTRRIIGRGIAKGGLDLRFNAFNFHIAGEESVIGLLGFAESGIVVQPYRLEAQSLEGGRQISKTLDGVQIGPYASVYDSSVPADRFHTCVGGGFYFGVQKYFLMAVELGQPLREQDGPMGIYINAAFSF